jgi:hypothetical protein
MWRGDVNMYGRETLDYTILTILTNDGRRIKIEVGMF